VSCHIRGVIHHVHCGLTEGLAPLFRLHVSSSHVHRQTSPVVTTATTSPSSRVIEIHHARFTLSVRCYSVRVQGLLGWVVSSPGACTCLPYTQINSYSQTTIKMKLGSYQALDLEPLSSTGENNSITNNKNNDTWDGSYRAQELVPLSPTWKLTLNHKQP